MQSRLAMDGQPSVVPHVFSHQIDCNVLPEVDVLLHNDPGVSLYPQPRFVAGTDEVAVGRVRRDAGSPMRISLWTVADNLRKGTALNALQIAEETIRRGRLHVRKDLGESW